MAETITVARPYARAAFEQARSEKGGLKQWSGMLQALAAVARDPLMQAALNNPNLGVDDKAALLLDISAEIPDVSISREGRNFVKVLADNRRLTALPDIAALFEELRAEAEKAVHVDVISAYPLSDDQRDKIAASLKRKLQCDEIDLEVTVDESLLGGAIIRAGDLVIDGSARGQLAKLATALRQ